jgi:hypothetical protein
MKGLVSFHPVDLEFFDTIIEPLAAGEKANPEKFLETALVSRAVAWEAWRYKLAIEDYLAMLEPPPPPADGSLWTKVRSRLENLDFKPDPIARLLDERIDPDLHLHGRPYLVTEGSAESVAAMVDEYLAAGHPAESPPLAREQLGKLDPELARAIEPVDAEPLSPDMAYRRELLLLLKEIYDLAASARDNESWGAPGRPRAPAAELLQAELPYRALMLHSRARPFWIARDVDGLETICRTAGVEPPACLSPAWRLFARTCETFPALHESLGYELKRARDIGSFVAPEDIADLLAFLGDSGARIIQAAARHGEGSTCSTLLRKIRECATYAQRHSLGYIEACGIRPIELPPDEGPAADGG